MYYDKMVRYSARISFCLRLIASLSLVTSQSLPTAEQSTACQTVYSREVFCLQSLTAGATSVSIRCPRNDMDLIVNQVQVLRLSSAAASAAVDCPTVYAATNSDSCLLYTVQSTSKLCITSNRTCSVSVMAGQNMPTANCFGYNGRMYAMITYTCQPRASIFANTSSVAMTIYDNTTYVVTVITVYSYDPTQGVPPVAAANDDTNRQLPFCSVYVPSSAGQIYVRFFNVDSRPNCVELSDGASNVSLCSNRSLDQQSMTLPCSDRDRFLRIRPSAVIQSLYTLTVQVNYASKLTIQCGQPPYPLYTSVPTTTRLPLPEVTTTTTTISSDKAIDWAQKTTTSLLATCFFASNGWGEREIVIAAVVGSLVAVFTFALGLIAGCICRSRCCCREERDVITRSSSSTDDVSKPPPVVTENDYVDITSIAEKDQGGDFNVYSSIRKIPPSSANVFVVDKGVSTAC